MAAPQTAFNAEQALTLSRVAEGRQLGSYTLIDKDGNPFRFEQLRGKPLVISMIYSSCFHTCPITTQTVARAVDNARSVLGSDSFTVISVGFDAAHDSPAALAQFAGQQGIDPKGWMFFGADAETRDRLAEDLGFSFILAPTGFDHIAQTTIVDAKGKIYRQVYGEDFAMPLLVEPLKDLILGRAAAFSSFQSLTNRVRFICSVYDPVNGHYKTDWGLFLEIGFGLTAIITIASLLARAYWESRRTLER